MDLDLLKRLLALMQEGGLTELEFEDKNKGQKVRLSRKQDLPAPLAMPMSMPAAAPPAASAVPAPAAAPAETGVSVFKAPMVGTFYRSGSPESEPYVQVGDRVNPQSTLCILEAMKVMNEIKAELSGEVVAILAENGEPVEFGQPLFKIKAA